MTSRNGKHVNSGHDVANLDTRETSRLNHFDLNVKVANASDNGIAPHLPHGLHSDDHEADGKRIKMSASLTAYSEDRWSVAASVIIAADVVVANAVTSMQ